MRPLAVSAVALMVAVSAGCGGSGVEVEILSSPTPQLTHPSSPTSTPAPGAPTPTSGSAAPTDTQEPTATATAVPSKSLIFVSAAGSDINLGTAASPLASISKAAQLAENGAIIVVAPGTYFESVTTHRSGGTPQDLTFIADTSGELSGVPAGNVVLSVPEATPAPGQTPAPVVGFSLRDSPGTAIDGFHITGATGGGVVVNNSPGARVQNCVLFGNSGANGDGIRLQNVSGVLLFNNLIYLNSNAGISIVGNPGSPDTRAINNTLYRNSSRGVTVGTTSAASTGAFLRNNILLGNADGSSAPLNIKVTAITDPPSTMGYSGDFDLVLPASYSPADIAGADDINSDPMLVSADAEPPDVHLAEGSPARDAGSSDLGDNRLVQCLHAWSTAIGGGADDGAVDLGYHYPAGDLRQLHCGVKLPE